VPNERTGTSPPAARRWLLLSTVIQRVFRNQSKANPEPEDRRNGRAAVRSDQGRKFLLHLEHTFD